MSADDDGRARELRVATFNIHHGVGTDGRLDLPRTAAALRALDADVIGLQEVDVAFGPRSAGEDQARRLGELLGMDVRFAAAIDRPSAVPGGPRRRYGPALLTRGEITGSETHLLPADPSVGPLREPRAVLVASVRLPGAAPGASADEPLTVLVTHLDHDRRENRAAQVRRIIEHAAPLADPAVLVGDMNADPGSPELRQLTGARWREAAAEIDGRPTGPPLFSILSAALPWSPRAGRATHPSYLPLRRLDGIWVRGPLRALTLEVPPGRASDHRPVVASLARA